MSGYVNTLHYNGRPTAGPQSSALSSAISSRSSSSGRSSSAGGPWKLLPQPYFVPQGLRPKLHFPRVSFQYATSSVPGVSFTDLTTLATHALDLMIAGGSKRAFATLPGKKIHLCILWPGYDRVQQPWASSIELMTPLGPITHSQLGVIIAHQYARFIEAMRSQRSSQPEWRVGTPGITFDRLVLLSLVNTCEDYWQADIACM